MPQYSLAERDAQLNLIQPYFSPSRGVPRADDLRVISGIIFVLKRGLQWRDAPAEYGPHKTLYNLISLKAGFINIDNVLRAMFFLLGGATRARSLAFS